MLGRWGMPGPPQFGGAPITNIRNTKSPHWRAWLKPENRCVPFNSFCEYADTKPRKTPTWFALNDCENALNGDPSQKIAKPLISLRKTALRWGHHRRRS